MLTSYILGPFYKYEEGKEVLVSYKQTAERLMDCVDSMRTEELYSHNTCTGSMIISVF